MNTRRRVLILLNPAVLAASLLALALAGCGTDLTPTPDVPSAPIATADADAEAVLARAQEVMGQVRSYRFRVEVGYEQTEQALTGEVPLVRTGAWTLPGHWVLQVDGTDAVLQADGRVFYRRWEDPESPWLGGDPVHQYPGFIPYSPFLDLDEATLLAEERVGGVSAYRVAGKTRLDDPAFRFPTTSAMTIELLVDQESYRVLQMTIQDAYQGVRASDPGGIPEPLATTPQDAITFHYYDFNAPITIDTPDAVPRSTP